MANIDDVIAKFKEATKSKAVKISVEPGETSPFESSFGGTPYLPENFEYPYSTDGETPMVLLAQINFAEVPHIEDFPQKGILQIFINPDDELMGMDFDNMNVHEDCKIFYHSDIDTTLDKQQTPPEIDIEENFSPVYKSLRLSFEIEEQYMTTSCYQFDEIFMKIYNKENNTDFEDLFCLPDEESDKVFYEFDGEGHRLGGHPTFIQNDPRDYNEEYRKYNTLLLQMDSEFQDGDDLILWGDLGVGCFLIKPEDLKNCKFDDVLYTWDCG